MKGHVIEELTRIIGADGLARLAAEHGGRRVVVPTPGRLKTSHRLAELLGLDLAQRLSAWAAGEVIEVPRCVHLEARRRDEAIRRDRATGMTQAELARRYKMSERWVRAILKRAEQPSGEVGI